MLGALPLALISGDEADIRQPLGISFVGGLAVSQFLTRSTTPVATFIWTAFGSDAGPLGFAGITV